MPQPDSSRSRGMHEQWSEPSAGWPVDPAAPRRLAPRSGRPRRCRDHLEDCRSCADLDGNEALERQQLDAAAPSSRTPSRLVGTSGTFAMDEGQTTDPDDEDRWVASRPFTLEDELEDTWPNQPEPARPFDE